MLFFLMINYPRQLGESFPIQQTLFNYKYLFITPWLLLLLILLLLLLKIDSEDRKQNYINNRINKGNGGDRICLYLIYFEFNYLKKPKFYENY